MMEIPEYKSLLAREDTEDQESLREVLERRAQGKEKKSDRLPARWKNTRVRAIEDKGSEDADDENEDKENDNSNPNLQLAEEAEQAQTAERPATPQSRRRSHSQIAVSLLSIRARQPAEGVASPSQASQPPRLSPRETASPLRRYPKRKRSKP
jgi:hypothetical protein